MAAENSLAAARRAADRWAPDYVELDVKYTSDRVPVNLHDATLNRTTNCSGRVVDVTLEELRQCRIDMVGSGEPGSATFRPAPNSTELVPTLGQMLRFSERTGTKLNVEIKNLPTESDYEPSPSRFVDPIIDLIHARGMLDRDHVLIQTFWPLDLDRAAARIRELVPDPARRPPLHLLTLQPLNEGAIVYSLAAGYQGLGPQWSPLTGPLYFGLAEASGLKVVPYTINDAAGMQSALDAGADGLITDDLAIANGVTGRPGPRLGLRVRDASPRRGLGRVRVSATCRRSDCVTRLRARLRLRGSDGRVRASGIGQRRFDGRRGRARQVAFRLGERQRRAARRTLRRGGRAVVLVQGRARDRYRTLQATDRARVRLRR